MGWEADLGTPSVVSWRLWRSIRKEPNQWFHQTTGEAGFWDERVPFTPSDASDLERSLWIIMEKTACGKPSHTYTPRECGWEQMIGGFGILETSLFRFPNSNWRNGGIGNLRDLEPTTQRALEEKLRQHWSNRLISHLAPHAADIPAMAEVMGDRNNHEEFLHLLGDARFSTLRQRCLAFEKLRKQGGLQIPWTEKSVRGLLSNLQKEECTPNYIQQAWDTLKWFRTKFQTLDVQQLSA